MKIVGVIFILLGIVWMILPFVSSTYQGSYFLAVIFLVGGFFLYRGRLGRYGRKSTP
jgi:uncharacterized membrane protein HdeD (DUF308 family)